MSNKPSIIHLSVPAPLKGRWIRASRAEGMRLTDWITNAVEDYMQQQLQSSSHSDAAVTLMNKPNPADVLALRERIQSEQAMGITAAQDYCAKLLHTSRRAWQQWESGDRKMHLAFWELVKIKLVMRNTHN